MTIQNILNTIGIINVPAPGSDPEASNNWNAIKKHATENGFHCEHFVSPGIGRKSTMELSTENYRRELFQQLSGLKDSGIERLVINTDSAAMELLIPALLDDTQVFYNPENITILVSNPMHLLSDDDGISYEALFRGDIAKNNINITEEGIQQFVKNFKSLDTWSSTYQNAGFAAIHTFVATNDLLVSDGQKAMFTAQPFTSTEFETKQGEGYFHNTIGINERLPQIRLEIYNSLKQ